MMIGSKENIITLFAAIGLVGLSDLNGGGGSSDSANSEETGDQVTPALSEDEIKDGG